MTTIITQYGFTMGPATVTRLCGDERHGVWISVEGKLERIDIRITKGGRLRVGKPTKSDEHQGKDPAQMRNVQR